MMIQRVFDDTDLEAAKYDERTTDSAEMEFDSLQLKKIIKWKSSTLWPKNLTWWIFLAMLIGVAIGYFYQSPLTLSTL